MTTRRAVRWKWGYLWVTAALFLIAFVGHWVFAWFDYVKEQQAHAQPVEVSEYLVKTAEATLENWQSEFLQLLWQVAGLMFLFAVGSPQSKEGEERKEEKLDWIMRNLDAAKGQQRIHELEEKYPKK
jgi:hypothetical protein